MFLVIFSYAKESENGKVRPDNSEWHPNGTPPKVIPGQKLSQTLKQHHQLAFWYLQKKENKRCLFL